MALDGPRALGVDFEQRAADSPWEIAAEQPCPTAADNTPIGMIRQHAAALHEGATASRSISLEDARTAALLELIPVPPIPARAIRALRDERIRRQRGRAEWERRRAAAARYLADNGPSALEAAHRHAAVVHDQAAKTHDRIADLIERQRSRSADLPPMS